MESDKYFLNITDLKRDHGLVLDTKRYFCFPEEAVLQSIEEGIRVANVPPEMEGREAVLSDVVGFALAFDDLVWWTKDVNWRKANAFNKFVFLLTNEVRHFNRALYRIRRAKYKLDLGEFDGSLMRMLQNDDLPFPPKAKPTQDEVKSQCKALEKRFQVTCQGLERFLKDIPTDLTATPKEILLGEGNASEKNPKLKVRGVIELIKVNDFVVSTRVVGEVSYGFESMGPGEPGFISSSHTSLSSGYSSPRP
jgi:hypothetical protein